MLFNSLTFIVLHIISLILYWSLSSQKMRLLVFLISSFVFYGWFYWPGLILLMIVILVNYGLSSCVAIYRKKWIFVASILLNLLNLSWFKYAGFLIENVASLLHIFNENITIPKPNYWLPLGISFYTFQFLGYLTDLYKREIEHEKSLLNFAVFKCLYAQLIAGPIVRADELLPQLHKKASFDLTNFQKGFFLMIGGLFIKICVADILSQFVNWGFYAPHTISTLHAWLTLYGFSFQILSDFWGYSTIAIGVGLMYGITLPNNFNFPYTAISLQDFWRRWHITLSVWFRDYLYIPLGGNKGEHGPYKNMIITMTIAGIWHGAGWNFIIWGFGHGLFLAIERKFEFQKLKSTNKWVKMLRVFLIFNIVSFLWVFFRALDFNHALQFINALALPPYGTSIAHQEMLIITLALFVFFNKKLGRLFDGDNFTVLPLKKQLMLTTLLILLMIAYADARLDFIYFNF